MRCNECYGRDLVLHQDGGIVRCNINHFNIYYIFQYPHFDVRRNVVHNIHAIAIYISCHEYVLSLKMALIAETCS
jgi:hypothetical protein